MALSQRELDDLKGVLSETVKKFLGFNETSLVSAALSCITKGYDKQKTVGKKIVPVNTTNFGRVWRMVPESDARCVPLDVPLVLSVLLSACTAWVVVVGGGGGVKISLLLVIASKTLFGS